VKIKIAFTTLLATSLVSVLAAMGWFAVPPRAAATATTPVWTEVVWPFPQDQWGKGKAFRCKANDCGAEVNLFLRAKIGFCNCTDGVRDDEDLDRMGDLVLLGEFSAIGTGHPISIAWMKGRSREYTLARRNPYGTSAISVVFNERCDMIAATAAIGNGGTETVDPALLQFLNSTTVIRWAEITLGL
jgi:hypothetical protein